MRRRGRACAVVAVASAVLVGTLAPITAHADGGSTQGLDQCSSGRICLWSATSYSGSFFQTTSTSPVNSGISTTRSLWNRASVAAHVYSGTGGSGSVTCVPPGTQTSSTFVASASVKLSGSSSC